MANQKLSPKIGVDNFHYFPITEDGGTETTYGVGKALPGSVKISFTIDSKNEIFYADNGEYDSVTTNGEKKATLECADLTPAILAEWFGQEYTNGLFRGGDLTAAEFACAWRIKKSNGAYRYIRLLKGTFTMPNQEAEGPKGSSVNFQTSSVEFTAIKRLSDGLVYDMIDTDDPNLPDGVTASSIETGWFSDPNWIPGA